MDAGQPQDAGPSMQGVETGAFRNNNASEADSDSGSSQQEARRRGHGLDHYSTTEAKAPRSMPGSDTLKLLDFSDVVSHFDLFSFRPYSRTHDSLAQMRSVAERFVRASTDRIDTLHELQSLRFETGCQLENVVHQARHLLDSAQRVPTLSAVIPSHNGNTASRTLQDTRPPQPRATASAVFETALSGFRMKQRLLSDREHALQSSEETAVALANDLIHSITLELSSYEANNYSLSNNHPAAAENGCDQPELPLVVAQLFDKWGTAKYLVERVEEVEFEYREEMVNRSLREDQDLPVEPSQDAFDEKYRKDLKIAEDELQAAKLAINVAREACVEQGYNPDDELRRERNRLDSEATSSEIGTGKFAEISDSHKLERKIRTSPWPVKGPSLPSELQTRSPALSNRKKKRNAEMIQEWSEKVESDGTYTSEQLQYALAISARCYKPSRSKQRRMHRSLSNLGVRDTDTGRQNVERDVLVPFQNFDTHSEP